MLLLCLSLHFTYMLFRRQTPVLQFSGLSDDWYNGMWQLTGGQMMLNIRNDHSNVLLYFSFHFISLSKNDLIMQLQVSFKFINSLSTSVVSTDRYSKLSSSGPHPRSLASRAVTHFCTNNGKNSGNVILEKWSRRLLLVGWPCAISECKRGPSSPPPLIQTH